MNTGSLSDLISSSNLGSTGSIFWPPGPVRWLIDALANLAGSLSLNLPAS
ncbi:hypothetical protein M2280_005403 [Prescottella agglutinans]|uniref:Uncharacterized protein n=1 Tax=Prescottella agglutinans TaxID=1644129 RepID=A0ABT6MK20_9NOCA|nr:hypothetical protein [Prescottella agglutinans]